MQSEFERLNDVVIDLSDYENSEQLNYFERARIKKRIKSKLGNKKSFPVKSAVVVAVTASVLLYTGTQTNIKAAFNDFASNIPIVRGLLDLFVGQPDQQIAEYKTAIGQTTTSNGVDVRLDEVLIDTGRLIISSTFHSNTVDLGNISRPFPSVFINDRDVFEHGGGGSTSVNKIDEQTYSFISAVDLRDTSIEGELQIKIIYDNLRDLQDDEIYKGNWGFSFETSAEQLLGDMRTISINRSLILDNGQEIQIENLELSPISTRLNYKMINGTEFDVHFEVHDSDGTILKPVSATTASENSHIRFPKLDEGTRTLTIIPYLLSGKEGGSAAERSKEKTYLYEERFEIDINH
ncbi:hypothetical protein J40TS1_03620 [Paenibacillus montaniterrae]|uniref:DUF4179 domain-containing protein n=1 Tax=Paenibacillus montaniterrae TaxID=429341 RepID=A0A920CW08_9BACL|nr:DUF4179 domain-containing protein [Paenibacillus montaniterrae]GIP14720.1 hypothetical protein J40TS1_03620 [Paenibacillus montaniterrae]